VAIPAALLDGAGSIPAIYPTGPGGINTVTGVTEARVHGPLFQGVREHIEANQGTGQYSHGRPPAGNVDQVPFGRQKIEGKVFKARTLVGQKRRTNGPLNILGLVASVAPGADQVDDPLNSRLNTVAPEDAAGESRSVNDAKRPEIIEESQQVRTGRQHLPRMTVGMPIALVEVSCRNAENVEPVMRTPSPECLPAFVHLNQHYGQRSGAGLWRWLYGIHHSIQWISEAPEGLFCMRREMTVRPLPAGEIRKFRGLVLSEFRGAVISLRIDGP